MDRPVLGHGNCATGDCGNSLKCTVTGATPSTLAEFTIQGDSGNDFYDLSLVDGYNVKTKDEDPESGAHSTPQTCPATDYSRKFKDACPTAYSYAYDDTSLVLELTM
ncbi:hypothetical protein F2Q69_00050297 [Brassica cretica]|uniref:Thaumatin-like protein n=1 Tax=Brassica cretica TaxID=69181 RepID=A0A8S9PW05_BRACR|nr:hypothetical protein F2Q69_00050297 [Brassica cretica]